LALVVQKYGGSSLGTTEKIKKVAEKALARQRAGNDVVVVASAMQGETDRLIKICLGITDLPDLREYDSMLSTGEQVSTALLAIAIQTAGGKARSLLGFQIPIKTDSAYKDARIEAIDTVRMRRLLDDGNVLIIAGFQGVDPDDNITTLGRGGSDTTAGGLAPALKAHVCELYSDVDRLFTADPNVEPRARRLDRISYEEVLELSSLGAKVLQIRSVEMAMKHGVPINCLSTFGPDTGTLVTTGDEEMESVVVSGVTQDRKESKITVSGVPDRPGVAAGLFKPLAENNISVDMIIQNVSESGVTDISFTVRKEDMARARKLTDKIAKELDADRVIYDDKIVKVSVVGLGMRSHAGVASKVFETLASGGINIQMISTSEIKVSCVVDEKYGELAIRLLHEAFGLDQAPVKKAGKKAAKDGKVKGKR
jgi:aspartate kinase